MKGVFSGLGALVIALIKKESIPGLWYIGATLILGFVAYGLSIFLYVTDDRHGHHHKSSELHIVN